MATTNSGLAPMMMEPDALWMAVRSVIHWVIVIGVTITIATKGYAEKQAKSRTAKSWPTVPIMAMPVAVPHMRFGT